VKFQNLLLKHVVLILFSIIIGFPFFYLVSLSLQSDVEAMSIPPKIIPSTVRFSNYIEALNKSPLLLYLRNSFVYAGVSTLLVVITSSFAGYALTKISFPGRTIWTLVFMSIILLPPDIRVVPLYTLVAQLGWSNTWQGLILPLSMTGFGVFFMRQYLLQLPNEIIEAARIDGASEIGIFFKIVVPLSKPVLGTLILLNFIFRWNEFLWPLVMAQDANHMTLTVGLSGLQSAERFVSWNIVAASAMFLTLPSLLLFLFMQRYIIKGVAIGVGK